MVVHQKRNAVHRKTRYQGIVSSGDDLPNALVLNAMLFNAGRFIGPPVEGAVLTVFGLFLLTLRQRLTAQVSASHGESHGH